MSNEQQLAERLNFAVRSILEDAGVEHGNIYLDIHDVSKGFDNWKPRPEGRDYHSANATAQDEAKDRRLYLTLFSPDDQPNNNENPF